MLAFTAIVHPANAGYLANFTYGFTHTSGEFFTILHDDDTWEPTFLEETVASSIVNRELPSSPPTTGSQITLASSYPS
ncbi:MAG: glycosyltransferase family 2 protein [Chloroflexi bacterium]|nr:glycosyltransferase family 2 protein [Chloroflexota bacterium]